MYSISKSVWNAAPVSSFSNPFQPLNYCGVRPVLRGREEKGEGLIDQRAHMNAMIAGNTPQLAQISLGDPDMQARITRHFQCSRPLCSWNWR